MPIQWVEQFKGVLFDLDGLLVNTEKLHFSAYKKILDRRGFFLNWDFSTFCRIAHKGVNSLQNAVYDYLPQLQKKFPDWKEIYQDKKEAYLQILKEEKIECMPGVDRLLQVIKKKKLSVALQLIQL